jgi:Reverse transcriptase (RNA-dependent DNA polymerase)
VSRLASNSLSHNCNPVYRFVALAVMLRIDAAELKALGENASNLYRLAKAEVKKDGSIRQTYDANEPLKSLHRKIKTQLLDRVHFPSYLTGSIKGRDYKTNAELHLGARIVISEDISLFFPSTTKETIFDIWQNFFGFGKKVAACLTALTTLEGKLPQGAITSPQLANLVFWRHEATLQADFQDEGITYSRFVDDIVASSQTTINEDQKTQIIKKIYGMMLKTGYKPKREKHEIATSGKRMMVTKLTVNSRAGIDKERRSKIRAVVHKQEIALRENSATYAVAYTLPKVAGKVAMLGRFHPGKANPLKDRLLKIEQTIPKVTKSKKSISRYL